MMLGVLVTNRARRGDISWTFLAFYLGALAMRVAYLGQRWAVWTHQLESGALLLFAFFMISDPMTGPNDPRAAESRTPRSSPRSHTRGSSGFTAPTDSSGLCLSRRRCVPLWDAIWPARKFEWTQNGGESCSFSEFGFSSR